MASLKNKKQKIKKLFLEIKFVKVIFEDSDKEKNSTMRLNLLMSEGWAIYNTFVFEFYVVYELGKFRKIE